MAINAHWDVDNGNPTNYDTNDEIKSLNVSINALHRDLRKGDSRIYNSLCSRCNHANLGGSSYCNMCGHFLR